MTAGNELTHHHCGVQDIDKHYQVFALDKPDPQSCRYHVNIVDRCTDGPCSVERVLLQFQDGDPVYKGYNGLTDGVLLSILIDRFTHAPDTKGTEIVLQNVQAALCVVNDELRNRHEKNKAKG